MKTRREDGSAARRSHGAMGWRLGEVYVSRLGEKWLRVQADRRERRGRQVYVASAQRRRWAELSCDNKPTMDSTSEIDMAHPCWLSGDGICWQNVMAGRQLVWTCGLDENHLF